MSVELTIQHNIADLNQTIRLYKELSGKSDHDILSKQVGKLAGNIRMAMKAIMRPKGWIREQMIARLKAGGRIKVRESIKKKVREKWPEIAARMQRRHDKQFWGDTLNTGLSMGQEMVKRELNMRERGRGVLRVSAMYPGTILKGVMRAEGRGGVILSEAGIKIGATISGGSIEWAGVQGTPKEVAESFGRAKPKQALLSAIEATRADILLYTARKQAELLQKSIRSMIKIEKAAAAPSA